MKRTELLSELRPVFHPRTVALVGASSGSGKVGRMFMERFVEAGFEKLYPVNPREKQILGVETYASVGDIPEPIDLALILTPPLAVEAFRRGETQRVGVERIAGLYLVFPLDSVDSGQRGHPT